MLLCLPFFYFCGQINFVWTVVLCLDPIADIKLLSRHFAHVRVFRPFVSKKKSDSQRNFESLHQKNRFESALSEIVC